MCKALRFIGIVLLLAGCSTPAPENDGTTTPSAPPATTTETPPVSARVWPVMPDFMTPDSLPRGLALNYSTVDYSDPYAVSVAFATACETWDTQTDLNPNAGLIRAWPFMTARLQKETAALSPSQGLGGQWDQWVAAGAYQTVLKADEDLMARPEDSASTAYRGVELTLQVSGEDKPRIKAYYLTLFYENNKWLVDEFSI